VSRLMKARSRCDFFPSGEWVAHGGRAESMHDEEFTKMASEGLASQFNNLDKLFQSRTSNPDAARDLNSVASGVGN